MTRKERYKYILEYFSKAMPAPKSELNYANEWGLLVAVMLSAQCTDKRVNMVTPALMSRYPKPSDMAASTVEEIFGYIRSVSYPNAKAEHLHRTAIILAEQNNNEVPRTREQLEYLPGVGRKTASVMLAVVFDTPAMPVDTHVFRVSHRIGLVTKAATTPLTVEKQLVTEIPYEMLGDAHHWLILHGRYVCKAISPMCEECGIIEACQNPVRPQKKLMI